MSTGVTAQLDPELSEDIAVLFGAGWDVKLERDYDGGPQLSCYKDGIFLDYRCELGTGHCAGDHISGREGLHRYARKPLTDLAMIYRNNESDGW